MDYVRGHSFEMFGSHNLGVRIDVSIGRDLTEEDRATFFKAADILKDGLLRETVRLDPTKQLEAKEERSELLACFGDEAFYVEETPYGYCNEWCCSLRRWYLVTTRIGRIEIGWRKRVIHLGWKDTHVKATAESLFPSDTQTTRGKDYIHAWSLEDAKRYIGTLLDQSPSRPHA